MTRAPRQEKKVQTNLRLTPTARRALIRLSHRWGISHADVVEVSLRVLVEMADGVGVDRIWASLPKG